MDKITLTKKEYLGEGYIHIFENQNGERVNIPCDKEDYDNLETSKPTLEGYTWLSSAGGTVKVDTDDTVLAVGQYTQIADKYVVCESTEFGVMNKEYTLEELQQKYNI